MTVVFGYSGLLAQPCNRNGHAEAVLLEVQASVTGIGSGTQSEDAPIERHKAPELNPGKNGAISQPAVPKSEGGKVRAEKHHLAEWMNQHSGMTLEQQERALEHEPGFQELPVPTQQRMRGRLAQLNEMTPIQRERILEHTEAMERLTLAQRSQVRGAMQQLSSLPLDQRRAVSRSFRELRQLPTDQRMAAMNGTRYSWMNQAQRTTLARLIQVAPMLPQH